MASRTSALITASRIEQSILLLRGQKVLLDLTLADLYGVRTKALVQAVKRNRERFPSDFLFVLDNHEVTNLRSQFGEGSSFSVERMSVTSHSRAQANEGCRPEQHGGWVRSGAAAAE
ncbi:MAG: ORF6N domain-containing protein [Betaproteobacteria bacterium]|nr:ORF6N domain-containing protein [Betaproteobacteria bacterium]